MNPQDRPALDRRPETLKAILERHRGKTGKTCLVNLQHGGAKGMTRHSGAELTLKRNAPIGSLSLGAERTFQLKHKKTRETD